MLGVDEIRTLMDLPSEPGRTRVVAAMSGGVDSAVAAALAKRAGYEVVGITLQLYASDAAVKRKGACCAGQDIRDAAAAAEKIGIPHYVLDYTERFRRSVMDDFAATYARGETPVPCIRCNETVKFHDLLGAARDMGAAALVTGHYIQRLRGPAGPELHRAVDASRDQSYFLFSTTRAQLDFVRFPLGGLPKSETRSMAGALGLPVADKPDSQDICFVPSGGYAKVIEKLRPGALESGKIVHVDGTVMGDHDGIINYTVGQRKGLGIGGGDALYVVRLDPAKHQVIVGPKEALQKQRFMIRQSNWLSDMQAHAGKEVTVKLRSMHKGVKASIEMLENGRAVVTLAAPEGAVSPGQACVAYVGDCMLGGGWITSEAV